MPKVYKYRLYPSKKQASRIDRSIDVCRLVYNLALEVKIWAYRNGTNISAIDLCYQLVDLRQTFDWIKEVDSQALQASVKKVDVAFKNFFRGSGFPKFKSKRNGGSFQCPNNTRKIDWGNGTLTIPKIKDIPIVLSRKFEGKIKTVTISRTATGKYFASILAELAHDKIQPSKTERAIGIDMGLAHFVVLSNGEKIDNPKYLATSLTRLKVMQRRAIRKKKGSQNRTKANRKVAVLHEKIANQRNDFLQKLSTRLIVDNQIDTFCVENLRVKNMVKNHRLARAISDVGWSMFITMLEYKGRWCGKRVFRIDQWYPSSKTCSHCGYIFEELDLSLREWICASCQTTHDRDVNAARNILSKGIESGVGSSEEPVEPRRMRRTMKQERIQM
ncbi:RNA-guided endonuclease TnpB family protein [Dinghuibacter silviterrae]|uniref:Putative transposase n=1 Tax=Dinghuibacter silviterrae TaxID=1539049 RepID=A0A4R8DPJ5_9BACT|nr:RNA-guided endonuclease TnpB family protein [Dinghuibacter silviterrae]TDX00014.1 putative transposase [Dinghuibacter silviterrae]